MKKCYKILHKYICDEKMCIHEVLLVELIFGAVVVALRQWWGW